MPCGTASVGVGVRVGVAVIVGVGVIVAVCVDVDVAVAVAVAVGSDVGEGVLLDEAVAGRGEGVAALLVEHPANSASSKTAASSLIPGVARGDLRILLKLLRIGYIPEACAVQ